MNKLTWFIVLTIMVLFAGVLIYYGSFFTKTQKLETSQKGNVGIVNFSHNSDYTKITGKLVYKDIEGGYWDLVFADTTDQFGGHFILGRDKKLEGYKDGDIVRVAGEIAEDQMSIYIAGIIYSLKTIELVK